MTNDELEALRAKMTEMAARYRVQQVTVYTGTADSVFGLLPIVGAYAVVKPDKMLCVEGESFEAALHTLEHKLIALRMGQGASR